MCFLPLGFLGDRSDEVQVGIELNDKPIYIFTFITVCIINKSLANDSQFSPGDGRMKFTFHLLEAAARI